MEPAMVNLLLRELRRTGLMRTRPVFCSQLQGSPFHSSAPASVGSTKDTPSEQVGRTGTGSANQVSNEGEDASAGGAGDVPPESTFDAGGSFHMQKGKHEKPQNREQNYDKGGKQMKSRGYCSGPGVVFSNPAPFTLNALLGYKGFCSDKPHIERERGISDSDFMNLKHGERPPREENPKAPPPGGLSPEQGKDYKPEKGNFKGFGEEGDAKTKRK